MENQPMFAFNEVIDNRTFREMVADRLVADHPHLLEKWGDKLGDPMMQTALWTIMDASDIRAKAAEAHLLAAVSDLLQNDEALKILRNADHISKWFDPWNDLLAEVSGDPKPHRGFSTFGDQWDGVVKEFNKVTKGSQAIPAPSRPAEFISREVIRILSPPSFEPIGSVFVPETHDADVYFSHFEDFARCFPTTANTQVVDKSDRRAWAAIALCDNGLGLAFFASQELTEGEPVKLHVEPVQENIAMELSLVI